MNRRFAAEAALLAAALLYGVTFPLVHDALVDITPFAYLLGRFGIATLMLAPFALARAAHAGRERRTLVRAGLTAGVILFGGYATQTVGLQYTSPSTSAFITGLYVDHHAGDRIRDQSAAAAPAGAGGHRHRNRGLYLLTGADVHLGRGELFTLACAVLFAFHIVYIGAYANRLGADAVHRDADRRRWRCCRSRPPRGQGVGIAQHPRGVRGRVHRPRMLGARAAAAAVGSASDPGDACRVDPARRAGVRRDRGLRER